MKITYKIMNIFTYISVILFFYIGAFLIQVYTAFCVYQSYGWFLGILAFLSPVLSEIVMFILYLIFYGLFNEYCIIILGYLLCVAFTFLLSYIASYLEEKVNKKNSKDINIIQEQLINNNEEKDELENIINNPIRLQNIIDGKEEINEDYLLEKQNPYTGKIIKNYDDILEYLVAYQKDCNGINPYN